MSNTVLEAQTGAATVNFVINRNRVVTLAADGLAGAEEVTIEHKRGASFVSATDWATASVIKLTATADMVKLDAPGEYRFNKPSTAGAVSLHLDINHY